MVAPRLSRLACSRVLGGRLKRSCVSHLSKLSRTAVRAYLEQQRVRRRLKQLSRIERCVSMYEEHLAQVIRQKVGRSVTRQ